ncbi:MAG TPA: hypothetical protein VM029_09775 [Opitutaceae bacterium]|nr:hypothetical protein [Opitutaceae bacterium]
MPVSLPRHLLLLLALVIGPAAAAKSQEETVFLFENRKVEFAVPEGLGFSSSKDERGFITVRVADRKDKVSLQMTFLPDGEGRFSSARGRKEFMHENFQEYVGGSVEKVMQFEELEPREGAGTYCVFTDANLVGRSKVPAGEFQQSTTGVKAWPGVVGVFTLMSNGTATKEYQAIMAMLKDSVRERPAPLK